jgi:hypothetical protein
MTTHLATAHHPDRLENLLLHDHIRTDSVGYAVDTAAAVVVDTAAAAGPAGASCPHPETGEAALASRRSKLEPVSQLEEELPSGRNSAAEESSVARRSSAGEEEAVVAATGPSNSAVEEAARQSEAWVAAGSRRNWPSEDVVAVGEGKGAD